MRRGGAQELWRANNGKGMERWNEQDEEVWVRAAKAGDLIAFDNLVRHYRPGAMKVARQILGPGDAAEDAAQDAMIACFKALPQLAKPERFGAWLGAIVRHRALRLLGNPSRQLAPVDALILEHAPSLTSAFESAVDGDSVRNAVRELPDEWRVATELYYFEDWTGPEIAAFLSTPLTTVKWRLHCARKRLRRCFALELEDNYD